MKPIFAKRGNLKIYAKIDWKEVYPIDIEIQHEFYLTTDDGSEVAASDTSEQYYAKILNGKGELVEYPPKQNGENIYILDEHGEMYLKLQDKTEHYPSDSSGNQVYAKNNKNIQVFAKNKYEKEYYAKNAKEDEMYPKRPSSSEYYLLDENREITAKRKDESEFYAKTKKRDEYYPKIYDELLTRSLSEEPISYFIEVDETDVKDNSDSNSSDSDNDLKKLFFLAKKIQIFNIFISTKFFKLF
ncbi:hypothetical protein TNCV_3218081 [Trichonephila clavipes]|nr:hypothetical protein TNCV_3218081 [Trichonephila clavipes]